MTFKSSLAAELNKNKKAREAEAARALAKASSTSTPTKGNSEVAGNSQQANHAKEQKKTKTDNVPSPIKSDKVRAKASTQAPAADSNAHADKAVKASVKPSKLDTVKEEVSVPKEKSKAHKSGLSGTEKPKSLGMSPAAPSPLPLPLPFALPIDINR